MTSTGSSDPIPGSQERGVDRGRQAGVALRPSVHLPVGPRRLLRRGQRDPRRAGLGRKQCSGLLNLCAPPGGTSRKEGNPTGSAAGALSRRDSAMNPVLMLLRSCQPPPGASLPPHPRRVISVSSSPPATQEFEDGVFTFAHDCQRDGGQARSPPTLLQPHSVSKVHKWCSSEGEGPGGRKGTRATSCSAAHGESSRLWLSLAIRPQASALQAALRPPPHPHASAQEAPSLSLATDGHFCDCRIELLTLCESVTPPPVGWTPTTIAESYPHT
ncbi:uncharacterized protein [Physeter macrocephalus]|uniref:Uncharacterized protein n=1 Tax=Physeter macrocephalus TaxID=9755 RepID=A0A455BX54_PHYMC|nr:uncharacterized protein LOC114486661 [Physeter catodon]|eukprot:XP_028348376.1 uncharacterized protein LOC114486661 [Physeter catodon]